MSKASPPLGVKVGIFTFVWYMWLNIWFQVLHTTGYVHIAVWETSIQESHRQRNCPGRVCMTYRKNSEKSHVRLSIELTADIKPISSPTFQCLLSLFFLCLKTIEIDFVKRSVNCARNVYMYLLNAQMKFMMIMILSERFLYSNSNIIYYRDGNKMSKRLKNYPDPMLIVHKYGADALR